MDRRPPYSNNVISMRYRRNAGDAAPAPQPSSGASPWSFLALLAVGYGVWEGMKYMAGAHREPVLLPGARLTRRNPTGKYVRALDLKRGDVIRVHSPGVIRGIVMGTVTKVASYPGPFTFSERRVEVRLVGGQELAFAENKLIEVIR